MLDLSAIPHAAPIASPHANNASTPSSADGSNNAAGESGAKSRHGKLELANAVASATGAPKPNSDKPAHAAHPTNKAGHSAEHTSRSKDTVQLSDEAQAAVSKLSARDREVRAHEAAHQAAGGQYAGAATYTYQTGPDGKQYAIGGEVPIDASPIAGDPEATIAKMRQVRNAALAPAEPSAQDRAVAAAASAMSAQAQGELAEQKAEALNPTSPDAQKDPASEARNASAAPGQNAEGASNSHQFSGATSDISGSQDDPTNRNPYGRSENATLQGYQAHNYSGGVEGDHAIGQDDRLGGSLNQILGELHPSSNSTGNSANPEHSGSRRPDLTAYATDAYRHQASSPFARKS
jgi:hypothetical protein